MKNNQTSSCFGCIPSTVEDYLALPEDKDLVGTSCLEEKFRGSDHVREDGSEEEED